MPHRPPDGDAQIREGLKNMSKLLGHRTRLGICVLLARNDALSFSRLKELLEETDGNLGAQLRKLEDEGFLSVRKEFRNRKPNMVVGVSTNTFVRWIYCWETNGKV